MEALEVFNLNAEGDLVGVEAFDQAGVGEGKARGQYSSAAWQPLKRKFNISFEQFDLLVQHFKGFFNSVTSTNRSVFKYHIIIYFYTSATNLLLYLPNDLCPCFSWLHKTKQFHLLVIFQPKSSSNLTEEQQTSYSTLNLK